MGAQGAVRNSGLFGWVWGYLGSQSVRVFDPTADARKALSGAERHFGAQEWSLLVGGWERGATPSNPPPNTPPTQQIWGGFSAKWGKFLTFSPTPPNPATWRWVQQLPLLGAALPCGCNHPPHSPSAMGCSHCWGVMGTPKNARVVLTPLQHQPQCFGLKLKV